VLRKTVTDIIPKDSSIIDMYGGYGAFALEYASIDDNWKALVLESSKSMVTFGKQFVKREHLAVRFSRINLRKFSKLDYPEGKYDCAVIDPPRSGIHGRTISFLNDKGPGLILYVSCDVAALARDTRMLKNYTSKYFQPIDMFPNTPEIETIAVLERNKVTY
jgi:23S rRNA (uracil1939-C5)-methyltransferase